MEFDRILPDNIGELEPLGRISVLKDLVMTYKWDGEPVSNIREIGSFSTLKSTLEWVSKTPNYLYEVSFALPAVALYGLVDTDREKGKKYLTLSTGQQSSISPSAVKEFYVAVQAEDGSLNLGVVLEPRQMVMFDRGLCVIQLSENKQSLNFNFNPGTYTVEELEAGVDTMIKRVNFVLDKILGGDFEY